jgi:hypothetical protein
MSPVNQLRFSVNDRIDNIDVNPARIPLSLLGEFQKEVADFLKGSSRDIDPSKVMISVEEGSLTLVASGLLLANSLWSDIEHLQSMGSLNQIDVKRAAVMERWQNAAQKNTNRKYSISETSSHISLNIDSSSSYKRIQDAWVHVEKYLHGRIVDMGGKTKANVHIELESDETLVISSTQDLLEQGDKNRLYRPALLHITAEENLSTGELRNHKLLAFENYQPSYNESEFNTMVEKGTKAWEGVSDSNQWLETLRGNHV